MDRLELLSPTNGRVLQPAGDHLLDDGERRWPVVDGIAYLRPKESLRAAAVEAIAENDIAGARLLLLRDQDDFSPTAPPSLDQLDTLLNGRETSLRAAMRLLNYGPVGDYFAYRWCSPTFASGLRMLELSVPAGGAVIEYACGIGHFLRELELAGHAVAGVDVVFSKLWLARRFLGVRGPLVCGDVERGPVLRPAGSCTAFCHDAFYFLRDKAAVLHHLRTVAGPAGRIALGHVHTDRDAHRAGHALSVDDYRELTAATIWDDASVADAYYRQGAALPAPADASSTAVAFMEGERVTPQALRFDVFRSEQCVNPLLSADELRYPSEGWKQEFTGDVTRMQEPVAERLRAYGRRSAGAVDAREALLQQYPHGKLVAEGLLLNLPELW